MTSTLIRFFVSIFILSFFLRPISSQLLSCDPYAPPHNQTMNLCDDFVSHYVFTTGNITQSVLDALISPYVRFSAFLPSEACVRAFLSLFCRSGFRECSPGPLPLPHPPCKRECLEMKEICANDFATLEAQFAGVSSGGLNLDVDCDMNDTITGAEMWPWSTVTYVYDGFDVTVTCQNATAPDQFNFSTPCPDRFSHEQRSDGDSSFCNVACPIYFTTPEQYQSKEKLMLVTSVVSLILVVMVGVPYTTFSWGRKYPTNLKTNINIALFGITVAILIATGRGLGKINCHDNTHIATQDDPLCGFQGALLIFSALSASFWFSIIGFHLMHMVIFLNTKKQSLSKYRHIFYGIGWGLPFILLVVALASKKVGSYKSATVCLLVEDDNFAWQYGLFYGPMCVSLACGWGFFLTSVGYVAKAQYESSRKITFKRYALILTYSSLGIIFYFIIAADRFYYTGIITRAQNSYISWLLCYCNAFANSQDVTAECGVVPSFGPNVVFDSFFSFCLGSVGCILMLALLLERPFHEWIFNMFRRAKGLATSWKESSDVSGTASNGPREEDDDNQEKELHPPLAKV